MIKSFPEKYGTFPRNLQHLFTKGTASLTVAGNSLQIYLLFRKEIDTIVTGKNFPRLPNGKIMPARMIKSWHLCRFSRSRRKGRPKPAWKNAGRTVKNHLIPLYGAFNNQRFSPTRIKTQLSRGAESRRYQKRQQIYKPTNFFHGSTVP